MKNGKTQAFQIFDGNVTLGKLSSMSDSDTIKLAKSQDKKYSTTGAIQEIKNYQKGKPSVGQEADFNKGAQAVADGDISIYYLSGPKKDSGETIDRRQDKIINIYPTYDEAEDKENPQDGTSAQGANLNRLAMQPTKNDGEEGTDSGFGKAIIKHIENSTYREPKSQDISVKNYTDNSGNKIVNQKIKYTAIDLFNSNKATDNTYKIAKENKADTFKLLSYASTGDYGGKLSEIDSEAVYGIGNDNDDADFAKYKSEIKQMDSEGYAIYQKLFGNSYSEITKGVYGNYEWDKDLAIGDPTSQKIYKSRYIGYTITSDGGSHILTKAQNDKQKAVLAK
ncbi:hypothetical protein [Companilactobacillus heilongjiangensis]|uniref:Uncharacterized protein n=1 Tax=Companilactobacillus heilongjiangensis TaxID=1074467 RepID=A0A0K2LEX3_9LACO|nr:hypothetical protein [Companilactobacillus heilongjiangensis]ALB29849.1 hypothetical protein JP39_11070 [Companilactobacillus heilongjiangensis]